MGKKALQYCNCSNPKRIHHCTVILLGVWWWYYITACHLTFYYTHFEITGVLCNRDLFANRTNFCFKSHLFPSQRGGYTKTKQPIRFQGLLKVTDQIAGKWKTKSIMWQILQLLFPNSYFFPPKKDEFNFKLAQYCINKARSASSIWNHKYDFRPKLHDTRFNYHFITSILKSLKYRTWLVQIFYWCSICMRWCSKFELMSTLHGLASWITSTFKTHLNRKRSGFKSIKNNVMDCTVHFYSTR